MIGKELLSWSSNCLSIILVDGGTDSLMRGDEESLGTPHEDFVNIAAVHSIQPLPNQPPIHKYLTCLGFGIDRFVQIYLRFSHRSFHGVNHALFLENVAQLIKDGAFLGTFSLLREMKEVCRDKELLNIPGKTF